MKTKRKKTFKELAKLGINILMKIALGLRHLLALLLQLEVSLGKALVFLEKFIPTLHIFSLSLSTIWNTGEFFVKAYQGKGGYTANLIRIATSLVLLSLMVACLFFPHLATLLLLSFLIFEAGKQCINLGKSIFKYRKSGTDTKAPATINMAQKAITLTSGCIAVAGAVLLHIIPGLEVLGLAFMITAVLVELTVRSLSWLAKSIYKKERVVDDLADSKPLDKKDTSYGQMRNLGIDLMSSDAKTNTQSVSEETVESAAPVRRFSFSSTTTPVNDANNQDRKLKRAVSLRC